MKIGLSSLQPLGRALMLPIAVLPVAGLLLRLGQPDLLNIAFLAAAGDAVFANLGLLFAVGVAVGLARDNNGAAGAKWIGVCGGLASEPAAVAILIGLGVRELSVAPAMTAEIKSVVRRLTLEDCRTMAAQALELDSAEAVRALAVQHLADVQGRPVGATQ